MLVLVAGSGVQINPSSQSLCDEHWLVGVELLLELAPITTAIMIIMIIITTTIMMSMIPKTSIYISHKMQQLFDIKKTQLELVSDRGYAIDPKEMEIFDMSLERFIRYLSATAREMQASPRAALSRSHGSIEPIAGQTRHMLVYYGGKTSPQQKQVSADVIRAFIGLIQRYGIYEAVLIVDAPISSTGNEELKALTLTKWQVFHDKNLNYNPTRHIDVPKHIR